MWRKSALRGIASLVTVFVWAIGASAQTAAPDWRHIGNAALDLALPSVATGPINRVWFSPDGLTLFVRTASAQVFESQDFEQWHAVRDKSIEPAAQANSPASSLPESGVKLRTTSDGRRLYGVGAYAYRSEDGGVTWSNLTGFKGTSILGSSLSDLAVSPRDADELVVAAATGVWRSTDGGLSWSGLNQSLPNLAVKRIYSTPNGIQGIRVSLRTAGMPEFEWAPGEKNAWKPSATTEVEGETALQQALSQSLNATITTVSAVGNFVYAGSSDGRLWSSSDKAATWNTNAEHPSGGVEAIYADPKDPRIALAVFGNPKSGQRSGRVLRTMNGGLFWDDITANLPEGAAHGIVADGASGAVYIATDAGVFFTMTDLASAGRATSWANISGNLPSVPAMDVKLDAGANQLFAAVDGYGVYAVVAPHRLRDVRIVNAADYSARPAAPGGLLSVLGTRVLAAQIADSAVPVLAASETSSQIQVPFEAKGTALSLGLQAGSGRMNITLPMQNVSPAIFVDPDGTPLVLDGDSGILLDGSKPAHAKSRIQILATGLGRVNPDWPTGVPAPLSDPPRVAVAVRVVVDGRPLEVKQATLAPGYIGFYLIEAILPDLVNSGPAELYVEADGQASNRVRLSIEP